MRQSQKGWGRPLQEISSNQNISPIHQLVLSPFSWLFQTQEKNPSFYAILCLSVQLNHGHNFFSAVFGVCSSKSWKNVLQNVGEQTQVVAEDQAEILDSIIYLIRALQRITDVLPSGFMTFDKVTYRRYLIYANTATESNDSYLVYLIA